MGQNSFHGINVVSWSYIRVELESAIAPNVYFSSLESKRNYLKCKQFENKI